MIMIVNGVESECNDVQVMQFSDKMDRVVFRVHRYCNGEDLYRFSPKIIIENVAIVDISSLTVTATGDFIDVLWIVDASFTQLTGVLKAQLSFVKDNKSLYKSVFNFQVHRSVAPDGYTLPQYINTWDEYIVELNRLVSLVIERVDEPGSLQDFISYIKEG